MSRVDWRALCRRVANSWRSFGAGLRATFRTLRRTKSTVRYPEQLPTIAGQTPAPKRRRDDFQQDYQLAPRFRGLHGLTRNPETGDVNCIGCLACSNVCPDHLISMTLEKRPGHTGRYPVRFSINIGPCCFCGLCSEVCPTPFRSLIMTDAFEWASYDRHGANLVLDREDLLANGDAEIARRAAGRSFGPDGELVAVKPEEEGNPYYQTAAESTKGKKRADATAKTPASGCAVAAAAGAAACQVPSASVASAGGEAAAEPPRPEETALPASPGKPPTEATEEELRARLVDLLGQAGLAIARAPEDVTPEEIETIEDRKVRSQVKVARRRLRVKLGLGE